MWRFRIIEGKKIRPQKNNPESGPEIPTKHRRTIFGNSLEPDYHRPNNVLPIWLIPKQKDDDSNESYNICWIGEPCDEQKCPGVTKNKKNIYDFLDIYCSSMPLK